MKYIHTIVFIFLASAPLLAQDYRIDLNLRASTLATFDLQDKEFQSLGYDRYWVTPDIGASMEALFFIKDFVGVGAFYTQSIIEGEYEHEIYSAYDYYYGELSKYKVSMYGLAAQITTSRKKTFRIYAVGRVGNYQMVEKFDGFTIGSKGMAYSAGFGVMLKISRRISFNIFEANYTWLPKEFSLENDIALSGGQVQSGLSVKLFRKK
jgi:hypothetical protein